MQYILMYSLLQLQAILQNSYTNIPDSHSTYIIGYKCLG